MLGYSKNVKKMILAVTSTVLLAVLLGCFLGYLMYWPSTINKAEVTNGFSVGQLINITKESDSLAARIETDKGIFYVKGRISALKGQDVSVKENAGGDKYLCFEHSDTCRGLLSY
jgi:hypothetical protein